MNEFLYQNVYLKVKHNVKQRTAIFLFVPFYSTFFSASSIGMRFIRK